MSHSHSLRSDFLPFQLPQHIPSLLSPSHSDEQPQDPRTAGRFGRLATHSLFTGFEQNTNIEISRAEVTPTHQPPRSASFCSVHNSGEDARTTPVSSEVDEIQSMGMLTSPLLTQKREANAGHTMSSCRSEDFLLDGHVRFDGQTTNMSGMAWLSRMVQLDQPHMRRTMFFTGSLASKWTGAFHVEQDKCEETVIEDEDWPDPYESEDLLRADRQDIERSWPRCRSLKQRHLTELKNRRLVAHGTASRGFVQDTSHVDLDGRDKLQDVKAKTKFQL